MTNPHYHTMIALGAVSATLPDGQPVRHPLSFTYNGRAESLLEDPDACARIDARMREDAEKLVQQLQQQGAEDIAYTLRALEQIL